MMIDFTFYTDKEEKLQKDLQEEHHKCLRKLYGDDLQYLSLDENDPKHNPLAGTDEFKENEKIKERLGKQIDDIFLCAYKRFTEKVLANETEYINLIKQRISLYTEYHAISVLEKVRGNDDNFHNKKDVILFILQLDIKRGINDIYTAPDSTETGRIKTILDQVDQLITDKAERIERKYFELHNKGGLEAYLKENENLIHLKDLPLITVTKKGTRNTEYPIDKVNSIVWSFLKDAPKNGQIAFAVGKIGSDKNANVLYSIDFEKLEKETGVTITKKLTPKDKRCYIACASLYKEGFEVVTITQIYNAMGNKGRPSAKDIKSINDSLTKMRAAIIHLDNSSEHEAYPKRRIKFKYDGSLLPMERVQAVVNGQTVDSAIHFFREPPLISFAKERNQITTINSKLLESPISKTDANLQLDDYLIERISRMKNDKTKSKNKMLYEKIYEKAGITTKMQRNRAKEKIITYLDHYKKCEFIKSYEIKQDGIEIKI